METFVLTIVLSILSVSVFSQDKGTIKDSRDNKTYKTIKIGTQIWMSENLNFTTTAGSWCFDNKNANCDKYGRLYDWENAKKACPSGSHLPTKDEFEALITNVGGKGSKAFNSLKSGGASGFNALMGGCFGHGEFYDMSNFAYFWATPEYNKEYAWDFVLNKEGQDADLYGDGKIRGFSIRCIKDK